jgi:peptide deformylase
VILKLVYYGNPILRQKSEPVKEIDDEIKNLIESMIETMRAHNGLGLSAVQVARTVRIFVMSIPVQQPDNTWVRGPLYAFVNPEILGISEQVWVHNEGCLSIPKLYADVTRPYRVRVRALNERGEEFVKDFEGMEARCILHENDHINGVLFIDRVKGKERQAMEQPLREIKKRYQ